jgi:biopolymer transport protein ExbD
MRERLFHLKPVFRPRYRVASGLLDVAPWIDTVLLSLVFFIAASATLKKPGLSLNLPTARAASGARYDAHVLSVPADGVYYFADQRVGWLLLGDHLREAATANPDAELVIEADGALSHERVTGLYDLAVDAGWKSIVMATRPGRAGVPRTQ